ncbi:OPT oligopeptide transporter protein-domain-containing protein [Cubamyces lactineus]|nr:OPT oligopeptide transporter protein-domain-containing protein [Cubamyces lactineus]
MAPAALPSLRLSFTQVQQPRKQPACQGRPREEPAQAITLTMYEIVTTEMFISGEWLSPEGLKSDPYKLKTDDIFEFGMDIVREDNKTIVHHKVAARVVCVSSELGAHAAHGAEQQHQQQGSHGYLSGIGGQLKAKNGAFNFTGNSQGSSNAGAFRRSQLQETQRSLDVKKLRDVVEERKREMEFQFESRANGGRSHGHQDEHDSADDDDARSIAAIVAHQLEPVDEADEDQVAAKRRKSGGDEETNFGGHGHPNRPIWTCQRMRKTWNRTRIATASNRSPTFIHTPSRSSSKWHSTSHGPSNSSMRAHSRRFPSSRHRSPPREPRSSHTGTGADADQCRGGRLAVGFLFQALSLFSFVCWIRPNDIVINQLFGTAGGLGTSILTFDWSQITWIGSPLMVPWWAEVQIFTGFFLVYWIMCPILYYTNSWDLSYFPIMANQPYDRYGKPYDITRVLTPEHMFDVDAYNNYSPLYLPVSYAITYLIVSALSSAMIVHTLLYHRRTVPDWWYLITFAACFVLAIVAAEVWHTGIPAWALVLAIGLPVTYIIPSGYVYAMTGQSITINLLAQIIPGMMLPGKPVPNMIFKAYAVQTLAEGTAFVQDLKLGHYMKLPPRATFMVQLISTVLVGLLQVSMKEWMFGNIPDICQPTQKDFLTCPHNQVQYTKSAVWGLIGPSRQFGAQSIYHPQLYAITIGAVLPIPFCLWQQRWPNDWNKYVNMPIVLNGIGLIPPATGINYSSWFLVGFIFQFLIRRRNFNWWTKFNYVLTAACDCGTVLSLLLIFFTLGFPKGGFNLNWWGNTVFLNTCERTVDDLRPQGKGRLLESLVQVTQAQVQTQTDSEVTDRLVQEAEAACAEPQETSLPAAAVEEACAMQEDRNEERERLRRAKEEWESRMRSEEETITNAASKVESRLLSVASFQAQHQQSLMNGNAQPHSSGGLVTPPSPRRLSAESTRPRQRRKRVSTSRGWTRSRSVSPGAAVDESNCSTTRDADEGSFSGSRRRSPRAVDNSSDSEGLHPSVQSEQNGDGPLQGKMPFPITPESSVVNQPISTTVSVVSGTTTDPRTQKPLKDGYPYHNFSATVARNHCKNPRHMQGNLNEESSSDIVQLTCRTSQPLPCLEPLASAYSMPSSNDRDREILDLDDESDDEESEDEGFGSSRRQQSHSARARTTPGGSSASGVVDYKQEFYALQQHTDQQKEKIREMEAKIALLVAQNKSRRKRKGSPRESAQASTAEPSDNAAADDGLSTLKNMIRDSAREFAHIHRAWPLPSGAYSLTARLDIDPLDYRARYPEDKDEEQTPEGDKGKKKANDKGKTDKLSAFEQACAAEMWDFVSVTLRPHIPSPYFQPVFDHFIGDQKSKIISAARDKRAEIFVDIPDLNRLIFSLPDPRTAMAEDAVCKRLCSTPSDTYPPIIYDTAHPGNVRYRFKTTAIANMIRLMLFGKASLTNRAKAPVTSTYGMKLGVKKLTCHMIAFAAVCVRHLLSADTWFDTVGTVSGFRYLSNYEDYMKFLIKVRHSDRMQAIWEWLEAQVFQNVWEESTLNSESAVGTVAAAESDDLAELEGAESDSGPGSPGNISSPYMQLGNDVASSTSIQANAPPTSTSAASTNITRRPAPVSSAPPSVAHSRRPNPIASAPSSILLHNPAPITPVVHEPPLQSPLSIDALIAPALANIAITDPHPAPAGGKPRPRPRPAGSSDGATESQRVASADSPSDRVPPPAHPAPSKKSRGSRQGKAAQDATVDPEDGNDTVSAPAVPNPPAPRRASTRTKKK